MNRIKLTVAAMGMFLVLPAVQGFAIEQGSLFGRPVTGGVLQNGVTTNKAPVLVQSIFFSCDKGTCTCKTSVDCGEMGRLGVCKAGTFKDGKNGGGSCTMKPA